MGGRPCEQRATFRAQLHDGRVLIVGVARRKVGPEAPGPLLCGGAPPGLDLAVVAGDEHVGHVVPAPGPGPRVLRVFEEPRAERLVGGGLWIAENAGEEAGDRVWLTLANPGPAPVALVVRRLAYGAGEVARVTLAAGQSRRVAVPVAASHHWYDLAVDGPDGFLRRFAGHVETGRPSWSDPAMGMVVTV